MNARLWPLQVFDPKQEVVIVERRLPHWAQAGTLCFITFRTHDSMPKPVIKRWHADREIWLRKHGIEPRQSDWVCHFIKLDPLLRADFVRIFSNRWHHQLDTGHGECVLSRPDISPIVVESLTKFDGDRYEMTDFVIMPNHVHLIAAFADEEGMLTQCRSWKHYTSRQINLRLGKSGPFWQQDGFDHLIRSEDQFLAFRKYIENNGAKAKLPPDRYRHYSKQLREAK